jgi:hypothetical protein
MIAFLHTNPSNMGYQLSTQPLIGGRLVLVTAQHLRTITRFGSPAGGLLLDPFLPDGGKTSEIFVRLRLHSPVSSFTTFWQYANSGPNPGDQDLFNGDSAGLGR